MLREHRRLVAAVTLAALLALIILLRDHGEPAGRIGLSTHLLASAEPLRPQLATLHDAGILWVREDFLWDRIEPERGRFDWRATDDLMAAAAHERVDVLAILGYATPWSTSDPGGDVHAPPRDDRDYAAYVHAVVDRYGPGGDFWEGDGPERPLRAVELWNEPWAHFFFKPDPDPERYAALARAGARAVRDAADGVDVLVPADLLEVRTDGQIRPWFSTLLEADGSLPELVDGWTVHPYPSPRSASPDAGGDPRFGFDRVTEINRIAVRAGAERPIWITELGWTTATGTEDGVREEQQAAFLDAALQRALGDWREFVPRTFVFTWSRSSDSAGDVEGNYGLRRADGTLKPAWRVLTARASGDG
jgi:polysaccharide biosynthesis protein PslG